MRKVCQVTFFFVLSAVVTSEILAKLNINVESLPQKCQQILLQAAESQTSMGIEHLDPIALSLEQSKHLSEKLEQQYEVLKLKQKNAELQTKIDRNNKFLADLRKDLESSRKSLAAQNPNPDNIQEHIRQLKQKVASYEENCEKAKVRETDLRAALYVTSTRLYDIIINLQGQSLVT